MNDVKYFSNHGFSSGADTPVREHPKGVAFLPKKDIPSGTPTQKDVPSGVPA